MRSSGSVIAVPSVLGRCRPMGGGCPQGAGHREVSERPVQMSSDVLLRQFGDNSLLNLEERADQILRLDRGVDDLLVAQHQDLVAGKQRVEMLQLLPVL